MILTHPIKPSFPYDAITVVITAVELLPPSTLQKRQQYSKHVISSYRNDYLNLDQTTAMISSTKTVMIAIVIMRFVAILSPQLVRKSSETGKKEKIIPTGHAPQSLDTPISITLTLQQRVPSMCNCLALPA